MTISKEIDVEQTISSLSIRDKVKFLSAANFWHLAGHPDAGIGSVRVSDGPNGVRGIQFFNRTQASCFPCAAGLASSFDLDLIRSVGRALGDEARLQGAHILLGPPVNMHQNPLGGRSFECFSEDPVSSGLAGAAHVQGLQERGVAACLKHFVANEQEYERYSVDSVVPEHALREVYLEPFRLVMKHAPPKCLMTAHNRVNGTHASENANLLQDILRKEWNWDGLVLSDWTGVYSVVESVKAGLDVEFPGPGVMRGPPLNRSLQAGKLTSEDVDARVRNVLKLHNYAVRSGIPFDAPEESVDTPELRALLRKAASSSIVLLKNTKSVLPLAPKLGQKIAVIGPNAFTAQISGGGSAEVNASYRVSPLQGIWEAAEEAGAQVKYAMGAAAFRFVPNIDIYIVQSNTRQSSSFMLMDGIPLDLVGPIPYICVSATFTPTVSGPWLFGLTSVGEANLFLNGELLIDNNKAYVPGETFFGQGSMEKRNLVQHMEKGKQYEIKVRMHLSSQRAGHGPVAFTGTLKLGAIPSLEESTAIMEAVEVAKACDASLPGSINPLVSAVLAVNPNTVVVNQSGTPVSMPWLDQAPAVVQAFSGGNELGHGLADVLFGKVNPSGKLAVTFPKRLEDCNTYESFGITTPTPGKVYYTEGIYVGYKHVLCRDSVLFRVWAVLLLRWHFRPSANRVPSRFPLRVTNTGAVYGAEVVQVYVSELSPPLPEVPRELKGFTKIFLKPGESTSARVKLDREAFRYWDERHAEWRAEKGKYEILVRASTRDVRLRGTVELGNRLQWTGM
ncbi:glycoside hydrolase family 3 protein [Dacryopinax primogenitus]|uniref:beta-glucosidase n=1 Tax=Dacryopinax primogenitus (strain DJM 731) TaxID=1858805 RepID=M5G1U5_DACPD|nr:glycoside hydrolase family 3 protein [Dacryopinax primogenitus]EJU02674.1 glycoside hydrolase family 3 protein [Dacryopinax primogenitus]